MSTILAIPYLTLLARTVNNVYPIPLTTHKTPLLTTLLTTLSTLYTVVTLIKIITNYARQTLCSRLTCLTR